MKLSKRFALCFLSLIVGLSCVLAAVAATPHRDNLSPTTPHTGALYQRNSLYYSPLLTKGDDNLGYANVNFLRPDGTIAATKRFASNTSISVADPRMYSSSILSAKVFYYNGMMPVSTFDYPTTRSEDDRLFNVTIFVPPKEDAVVNVPLNYLPAAKITVVYVENDIAPEYNNKTETLYLIKGIASYSIDNYSLACYRGYISNVFADPECTLRFDSVYDTIESDVTVYLKIYTAIHATGNPNDIFDDSISLKDAPKELLPTKTPSATTTTKPSTTKGEDREKVTSAIATTKATAKVTNKETTIKNTTSQSKTTAPATTKPATTSVAKTTAKATTTTRSAASTTIARAQRETQKTTEINTEVSNLNPEINTDVDRREESTAVNVENITAEITVKPVSDEALENNPESSSRLPVVIGIVVAILVIVGGAATCVVVRKKNQNT